MAKTPTPLGENVWDNVSKALNKGQNQMKILATLMLLSVTAMTHAQSKTDTDATSINPNYDQAIAQKLGGDEYGMKSYFLVILKTGAQVIADKQLVSESFKGHMDNINRLVEEGKLIIAGPLGKNDNDYRGIFIFNNVATRDDLEEIMNNDLAVKNGLLDYDIFTWYGSAAIPEYLPISDKIWKAKP